LRVITPAAIPAKIPKPKGLLENTHAAILVKILKPERAIRGDSACIQIPVELCSDYEGKNENYISMR